MALAPLGSARLRRSDSALPRQWDSVPSARRGRHPECHLLPRAVALCRCTQSRDRRSFRGGSAVLRAAAKDARVRSTVVMCGPTDYARWIRGIQHYSPSTYRSAIKRYGVTPDDDPQYFQAISPISYAGLIKTPVLLVQGGSDLRTPADHAQWMYEALVEGGNPRVRLEVLPGLGHAFEDGFGGYGFAKVVALVQHWFAETL